MSDLTVANEILRQLGGNKFKVMTGAKNFIGSDNMLSFQLPARFAKDGINAVRIKLTSLDLYDVEFLKCKKYDFVTVKSFNGIYDDMLVPIFEKTTGLDTHL